MDLSRANYAVPDYCFNGCTNLMIAHVGEPWGVGKGAFEGTMIGEFSSTRWMSTISESAFRNTNIWEFTVYEMYDIHKYAFDGAMVENFYFYTEYPPWLGERALEVWDMDNLKIHVPFGMIDEYKNSTPEWTRVASRATFIDDLIL